MAVSVDQTRAMLVELATTVRPHAAAFSVEQVAAVRNEAPVGSLPEGDWFWEAVGRSCAASIGVMLDLLVDGGEELPQGLQPEGVELARAVARAGLAPDALTNVFRAAQTRFWVAWRERIDALELEPALALAVLDQLMAFAHRYFAWMAQETSRHYLSELESSDDTLLALVRQVVDGHDATDSQLGYPLQGRHLALAVSGPGARRAVAALAGELGNRPLVVLPDADTAWAWLPEQSEPDERTRRRLAELAAAAGATVGIGSVRATIHGFRRSHHEAGVACRCALAAGAALAAYGDVLPEALALGDPHAGEELVARTLGPLGDGVRGQRLRQTLRAYCETGNGASAASLLGVSRRTLTYRIAEIERRLGAPIASRRTEIDLALRLEPLVARAAD